MRISHNPGAAIEQCLTWQYQQHGGIDTAEHIAGGLSEECQRLRNALERAEMDINVMYMALNKKDELFAWQALERIRQALRGE